MEESERLTYTVYEMYMVSMKSKLKVKLIQYFTAKTITL